MTRSPRRSCSPTTTDRVDNATRRRPGSPSPVVDVRRRARALNDVPVAGNVGPACRRRPIHPRVRGEGQADLATAADHRCGVRTGARLVRRGRRSVRRPARVIEDRNLAPAIIDPSQATTVPAAPVTDSDGSTVTAAPGTTTPTTPPATFPPAEPDAEELPDHRRRQQRLRRPRLALCAPPSAIAATSANAATRS